MREVKVQVCKIEGQQERRPNAIHEWGKKESFVKSLSLELRHQARDSNPLCGPYLEAHC